jgi:membrane protein DedA with SNARE-associated domain
MDEPGADLVAVNDILDWLTAFTYPVVFVGTLIDASGVPFPGRVLLVAAGALAGTGRRSLVAIIVLGASAAILMDHAWYLAGARGSERILRLYRRLAGLSGGGDDTAVEYFTRYGAATIVLGRFFTSVRALAWPVAAAHGIGYPKFFVFDLLAASLWASVWVLLGWALGERWKSTAEAAGGWLAVGGAVVLALAAAPLAMRLWRRRARRGRARRP